MELPEVRGPAVREVGVGLGRDARGDGRQRHQVGVRGGLAAEDHERASPGLRRLGAERVEAVLPVAVAAEHPDDDEIGAFEHRQDVGELVLGRVRQPVGRPGSPGREQIGVRGRQQQMGAHGASVLPRGPRPGPVSATTGVSGSLTASSGHSRGTAPGFHRLPPQVVALTRAAFHSPRPRARAHASRGLICALSAGWPVY